MMSSMSAGHNFRDEIFLYPCYYLKYLYQLIEVKLVAKKKQSRDMQGIVVGTILVLVLVLGIYSVYNQFFGNKETVPEQIYAIDYTGQPVLGNADAKVKVMEFGDYKCPVCKQFHETILPQLKRDYIDTGKVSYSFTNTQIIGPDSLTASEASEAVYKQNPEAFWKFHDAMYKNQGDETKQWATPAFLVDLIKKHVPEVNAEQIATDLEKKTFQKQAKEDNAKFDATGITGVPAVFVNGKYIENGLNYSDIKAAIEKELQAK
jgi:protein-disulfide isomerase